MISLDSKTHMSHRAQAFKISMERKVYLGVAIRIRFKDLNKKKLSKKSMIPKRTISSKKLLYHNAIRWFIECSKRIHKDKGNWFMCYIFHFQDIYKVHLKVKSRFISKSTAYHLFYLNMHRNRCMSGPEPFRIHAEVKKFTILQPSALLSENKVLLYLLRA